MAYILHVVDEQTKTQGGNMSDPCLVIAISLPHRGFVVLCLFVVIPHVKLASPPPWDDWEQTVRTPEVR